jgi:hypothetical protein
LPRLDDRLLLPVAAKGQTTPVNDVHSHSIETRAFRLTLVAGF